MPSTFQIWIEGMPSSPELYERLHLLEVEENADLPGALQLRLPITRTEEGDLSPINDEGFQPMANIAVVATVEGRSPQCIFDGYVLSHKIHLETGVTASYVEVYAQDSSWLMKLEEKTREWGNVTDGAVANTIFREYGITPFSNNLNDDSPTHTEDGHTLMQRNSDCEFLRTLARRTGKLCRVVCESVPGHRIGIFAKPNIEPEPVVSLRLNDPLEPNIRSVDVEWDVMRPANVVARQSLFTDSAREGANGDASSSGISAMDKRDLSSFAGHSMTTMLSIPVDDGGELRQRAEAVLLDSGWFVRCTGEADVSALHEVLRVGDIVSLETVGSLHSGRYLVWSVRHRIDGQSHVMAFVLVRNAVGSAASASLGGLI